MKRLSLILTLALVSFTIYGQTTFSEQASTWGINLGGSKDGGHSFADFDDDGDLDILINTFDATQKSRLYRNNGNNTYTDVTSSLAPSLLSNIRERSAIWGDLNNDGRLDFLRNTGTNGEQKLEIYIQSSTGVFGDGIGGTIPIRVGSSGTNEVNIFNGLNSEGVGFVDFDGDGDLDIIFDNHDHGIDILRNNYIDHTTNVVMNPSSSGLFTHATKGPLNELGLAQTAVDGDYGSLTDVNNDGWVDIFMRKRSENDFFLNQGGVFTNGADLAEADNGNKGAVALYDFDNDGDFDGFWTENGLSQIFRNDGAGTWTALGTLTGIPTSHSTRIDEVSCGDIDNDGDIDILLVGNNRSFLYYNQLNSPTGGVNTGLAMDFVLDASQAFNSGRDGEGTTMVDIDDDGDLDIYMNINGSDNQLWINNLYNSSTSEVNKNYLFVNVLEDRSFMQSSEERPALGATLVLLDCDDNVLSGIREVNGGNGHGTQDPNRVHFGLPFGNNRSYKILVKFPNYTNGSSITREEVIYFVEPSKVNSFPVTVTIRASDADLTCPLEICDNELDDDGDGLIDGFDPDCPCSNTDTYYGNCTPACEYTPPVGSSSFDITTQWASTSGVTNISQLFAADMDGVADGIAEIAVIRDISYNTTGLNALYFLNGADGSLKYHPNTLAMNSRNKGIAIGDADGDGRAEFYYMTAADEATGNSRKIACYEYNPSGVNPAGTGTGTFTLKWVSNTQVTCGLSGGEEAAVEDFTIGLADFNFDGTPEVYVGNEIYNALTGVRIATGGTNAIGSWNQGEFLTAFHVMAVTVAVDVLPDNACTNCNGLELVAGNQVYAVDISGGIMTVQQQAPNSLPDGNTAIADYDLDGDLDAIITTNDASHSFLYIWDLQTNTQIGAAHTVNITSTLSYHPINLPVIADFDGDDRPEIGVCGNLVFQVVDDYLTDISGTGGVLWSIATTDNSGQTGAAVFDFNGDGVSEVVYRDESNLRIMSGPTGSNLGTFSCLSATGGEYPIIADIDNDDETEIVCNCTPSGSGSLTSFTNAFKSNQFPWVPTRQIWNQYAYFNVNINDDLTVPQQQQLQHFVGQPSPGTTGSMNVFLKQVSPLDINGDFIFPSPDLTISTIVDASNCQNGTVDLAMTIVNSGDGKAPAGMPVSIYQTDPEGSNASILTTLTTASLIDVGNTLTLNYTLNVSSFSFPTTIYVVVNDDGSISRPYSLSSGFPSTSIGECNFSNNKNAVLLSQGCTDEDCTDGIDNDGDGFIDCADSDCKPVINNVTTIAPTCANRTSGQITINATSTGTLTYSINQIASYQSSNIFSNLMVGSYIIRVKNNSGCITEYINNPVVLDIDTCLEICNDGIDNDGDGLIDCDDPNCDDVGSASTINNN